MPMWHHQHGNRRMPQYQFGRAAKRRKAATACSPFVEKCAHSANPELGVSAVHPDARSIENRLARVIAFGEFQHTDHVIALVDCTSKVQIVHYANPPRMSRPA
jgi:hypothetical protein